MDYHSAIKGNEVQVCVTTQMNLKTVSAERNQSQRTTYIKWFHLYEMSGISKPVEWKYISGCLWLGGGGDGDGEWLLIGMGFWGEADKNVLKLIMVMVAQLSEDTKNHWIVQLKWVSSTVCESFNKDV